MVPINWKELEASGQVSSIVSKLYDYSRIYLDTYINSYIFHYNAKLFHLLLTIANRLKRGQIN